MIAQVDAMRGAMVRTDAGEIKDFELTMRLRNNQLKTRRLALGLTLRKFAERVGVSRQYYTSLETMNCSPLCGNGTWRKVSLRLAEFYRVKPGVLFPNEVLAVKQPVVVREIDAKNVVDLLSLDVPESDPELLAMRHEEIEGVQSAISRLTSNKQRMVMRMRMEEYTLEEIAKVIGITRESVRQVEGRAIRAILRKKWIRPQHAHGTRDGIYPAVSSPE